MFRLNTHLSRVCLAALVLFALAVPAGASADTTISRNWAGYAVHRPGVVFRRVSARWREPRAACVPGVRSFAAFWVGLGGYNTGRLEQAGTEGDCGQRGHATYYAWYELVPSAVGAVNLPARVLRVRPGDVMSTSVTVTGSQVTIWLRNITRHKAFHTVAQATAIDLSSAEWIVEAPCAPSANQCVILPLGNFRSVTFRRAEAEATSTSLGPISDPFWQRTRINLHPRRQQFVAIGSNVFGSAANASRLHSGGKSFSVRYSRISLAHSHVSKAVATSAVGIRRSGRL